MGEINMWSYFKAEITKYIGEIKCYYPDHLVGLVVTYILFVGFLWGLSGSLIIKENLFIGFMFWYFASTVISEGSMSISEEKQTGTFEQLLLKPANIILILSIRTIVWFIFTTIKVIILLFIVYITLQIDIKFNYKIIPILIITLVGLYGFGMILSASTLLFTKTASFESIISYLFLFFTGGLIPLEQLPKNISYIAQALPLTKGIELAQNIVNNININFYDIISLIINSLVYLFIGIFCFRISYHKSQVNGLNSQY
jgi:ABC-2 type transport system permease protein